MCNINVENSFICIPNRMCVYFDLSVFCLVVCLLQVCRTEFFFLGNLKCHSIKPLSIILFEEFLFGKILPMMPTIDIISACTLEYNFFSCFIIKKFYESNSVFFRWEWWETCGMKSISMPFFFVITFDKNFHFNLKQNSLSTGHRYKRQSTNI